MYTWRRIRSRERPHAAHHLEHVTVCPWTHRVDTSPTREVRARIARLPTSLEAVARDTRRARPGGPGALAGPACWRWPSPRSTAARGSACDEVGVLLRETGARAVHLPVWETLCCGALTLAATGTEEQQQRVAARRRHRRGAADAGAARGRQPASPATPDTTYADGTVTGRKIGVTHADEASRLLVTARSGDDAVVVRSSTRRARACTLLPVAVLERGRTQHTVVLDGAPAEPLGRGRRRTPRRARRRRASASPQPASWPAPATSPPTTSRAAPSSAGRWRSSRPSRCRSRTSTSPPARLDLAADNAAWRIARGPRRQRRPRGGGVLDLPEGAEGAAHLPPPARRDGRRRDLPAAPLLLVGHRHRARARRRCRATSGSRTRPPRTSS